MLEKLVKTHLILLAMVSTLAIPSMASAQDDPFLGLGVRLEDPRAGGIGGVVGSGTSLNVFVPINVLPILRIEPDIGFGRSASVSDTVNDEGTVVLHTENKQSAFRVGVGGFYMLQPVERTNIYVGGRLGFVRNNQYTQTDAVVGGVNINQSTSTTRNDVVVTLATGGEAYLSTHFSIGGEFAFDFVNVGDPAVESDPPDDMMDDPNTSTSNTLFVPSGALFLRWFFM